MGKSIKSTMKYKFLRASENGLKQTIDCQLGCCAVSGISLFTSISYFLY